MRLPPALQSFDTANLRLRLISSAFMAPIVLLAVYLGGLAYGAVLTCALTIGLYEWLRLVAPGTRTQTVSFACAMLVVLMTGGLLFSTACGAVLGTVFTFVLFFLSRRDHNEQASWVALGIPYMGISGLALLALRATPNNGAALVFYLLITVWSTDVGAFAAGRLIGGRKLAPTLSPNKTWAGLFGGMALAFVVGYLMASLLGAKHPEVALVLSPVLAAVAQGGDLFESALKRRSGVKESGDLIPGHGGILDRIDGLVFVGIFVFLFQTTIGTWINWW
jgi:phosphatidate cytidylyltransferase